MKKSALTINLEYYAVRLVCGLINSLPYAAALMAAEEHQKKIDLLKTKAVAKVEVFVPTPS